MLASQLKDFVIIPVLDYLELNSESAVNLLLGTAAIESEIGTYVRQIGFDFKSNEGAYGLWGIELFTHTEILNYLRRQPYKAKKINNKIVYLVDESKINFKDQLFRKICELQYIHINYDPIVAYKTNLIGNLYYQCAIARCRYLMIPEPLPASNDIESLAKYWKKYYNTEKGKGTIEGFINNYKRYVKLENSNVKN